MNEEQTKGILNKIDRQTMDTNSIGRYHNFSNTVLMYCGITIMNPQNIHVCIGYTPR